MVDVLRYCRSILRFGRQVAKVAISDSKPTRSGDKKDEKENTLDVDVLGGRFNAFLLEDDDEEDDEDDIETIRQRRFPNFKAPEAPAEEIDIEQVLINGDDRFQAIALLQTMDDLMGAVENHYGMLKRFLRGHDLHQAKSPVQLVMECAVVANMAVQSVHTAENALMTNHPHLSSFYHVLALVFMTTYVADVKKMITDKAKLWRFNLWPRLSSAHFTIGETKEPLLL
jgi:hypothetical protein